MASRWLMAGNHAQASPCVTHAVMLLVALASWCMHAQAQPHACIYEYGTVTSRQQPSSDTYGKQQTQLRACADDACMSFAATSLVTMRLVSCHADLALLAPGCSSLDLW